VQALFSASEVREMRTLLLTYLFVALATAHTVDRWWEIRLSGKPMGYQHVTTETLPNGNVRTTVTFLEVYPELKMSRQVNEIHPSAERGGCKWLAE
jgi:hypothetical protein